MLLPVPKISDVNVESLARGCLSDGFFCSFVCFTLVFEARMKLVTTKINDVKEVNFKSPYKYLVYSQFLPFILL